MLRVGMAAIAAALLCSTSAYAQSASWTISEASGRVVVRDGAGDRPGARGAAVPAGATVMTGTTGRAILVRGQDFVTLSANARMRLPEAAKAGGLFQMIQEWGNALFRIEHRRDPHFAVQAPYLAAVVKGTTFSVTVTREGSSVQVIEGAVEAATADGGAHELIRPGAVASVMASDRFRLTVQGQNAHSVDSPARGRGGASAPATPTPNGASTSGDHNDAGTVDASGGTGSYDDIAWQQVANSVVAAPIEAKPADLGKITDGLVSGKSNGTAVASAVAIARAGTSGSGNGNGSGGAVSNGNGNGSSAATGIGTSGNGASSGTGNSSGNGNSAGSANANGNSGNGNGGASDNGNGSGNENGNSGNGSGNGGASDSGSGSGNGNGNSGNGNGNGGGDGNNPGNGNTSPGNGNGGGGKPKG